ncbi:helix-turn-helix transcriptional regulator [Arthrobacter monumenti]
MRNLVKERRREAGLSQEQLASRLGVSRQTIISIERERFDPSLDLAFRLAGIFDAQIEELFLPPSQELSGT